MCPSCPPKAKPGFYSRHIAPYLVHGACSLGIITEQRKKVVPLASGVVLEVGIGSGLNVPHYDPARVKSVIGVDPDAKLHAIGQTRMHNAAFPLEVLAESAEEMSLETGIADTALVTYSFCTIPHPEKALAEIRRVLKPGGRLLFCEHGRSTKPSTAKWQDRINPIWKRFAGGCNINRNIAELISGAGFEITELENYSLPQTPSIIGFHYRGAATPR